MFKQPRIMKPLPRVITHELKKPGELLDYLTYQHIMASGREIDREEYMAKRAALKAPKKITKRYAQ